MFEAMYKHVLILLSLWIGFALHAMNQAEIFKATVGSLLIWFMFLLLEMLWERRKRVKHAEQDSEEEGRLG